MHILQQKAEIVSTREKGTLKSVSGAVDALNNRTIVANQGLCVVFSSSKDSYWLLWRSDKEYEAERISRDKN